MQLQHLTDKYGEHGSPCLAPRTNSLKSAILLTSLVLCLSLGMEYKALRVFNPRTANKVIIFILAITSLYITWTVHYTVRNTWPLLEIHRENEIRDFNQQWCRMHWWRVDWEDMVKPCRRQEAWELRQVNSEWRTDASRSFIKKWEIQPAGKRKQNTL